MCVGILRTRLTGSDGALQVQLALSCLLFALVGVALDPGLSGGGGGGGLLPSAATALRGFTPAVALVVANASLGGLLVAVVVRDSGAVAKGFATSLSIVGAPRSQAWRGRGDELSVMRAVSTVLNAGITGDAPGRQFSVGAALVVAATSLYSM